MNDITEISNRIKQLRLAHGMEQTDVASYLGYKSFTTISKWENGKNLPDGKKLTLLAKLFNTTTDYILHGEESAQPLTPPLPDSVSKLNQELNQKNHTKWLDYGNELLDEQNQTVEEGKITYMSDYRETIQKPAPGKVSAGTGYWQEDDYNTMVSFYIDEIPEDDEYDTIAITVGNSMAPKIKNGDFLFIKLTNQVNLNTIGIFQINGENFVKKLRDGYLESLNPDFDDIELSEFDDIRIIGEVVYIYREN